MLDILSELIRHRSLSRDANEAQLLTELIAKRLADAGMKSSLYESNNLVSLIASTQSTNTPKVLLQAHLDVVPANDRHFKLAEKDGKLLGRGVYDMKFAAACYLQLIEDLKEDLDKYDFGIMFTFDEEVGGKDGVGYLLNEGYGAEVCILPDGGDNWNIETGCNGVWIVHLIAKGKNAHGSRPWEGECAVNRLLDGLNEIRPVFGELGPEKCSLVISQLEAGTALNQVAAKAQATLDMRFTDNDQYEQKRAKIKKIAAKHELEIETLAELPTCETDMNSQYVQKFMEVAETVRGKPLGQKRSLGASDSHYFAALDIPVILVRPDGGGAHSDEEWIDKQGLDDFYEVLKAYVMDIARIK